MSDITPSPTQSTTSDDTKQPAVSSEHHQPVLSTDVDNPSHPLYHHRRIVTDFDYGDILGEGSYSTVLIGKDKRTGKQYAIKRLDKAHIVKNNKVKYVMIERDALSRMNHPGIVKLYWTYKDNRSLYFVLDLARNGELYTYIRRLVPFDMDTAKFYAAEILLAIEHIHNRGVIHRDIKPENILLDDGLHIKITDFGSAKILNENEQEDGQGESNGAAARSFVGTAEYVSPELLRSDPVSKEADLWAFGCVIYQMLSGKSPFKAATDYLIFQKIKNLEYTIPDDFPEVARNIIQRLLVSDPEERFGSASTGGIQAIKDHPFFEGIDWDNIFTSNAPPLRERLEKEMKAHPIIPPTFDFGDEGEAAEDNPWLENDHAGIMAEEVDGGNPLYSKHRDSSPHSAEHHVASTPSSSTSTPSAQLSDALLTASNRHHSRQSSTVSQQQNRHSMNRISHAGSEMSSSPSISDQSGTRPHPPWIPHLYPNESVVKAGRVNRRRGFISKKRNLILTNRPRLLYLDEGTDANKLDGNLRCEIPWTSQLMLELKGKSTFCLHTPEKSYTFEDRNHAQEWVNTINSMLVDSFGVAS